MSQPISGFLFDREMRDAGFTRHEMSNQRLRDAAYRLLVRGRLYRFDDADEIEYGVSGPFNDDEARAASPQAAATLMEVRRAIADYHFALDSREHGGLAQDRAFNAICKALDMHWNQGEELKRRAAAAQPASGVDHE